MVAAFSGVMPYFQGARNVPIEELAGRFSSTREAK
jgi:hypothetical protein